MEADPTPDIELRPLLHVRSRSSAQDTASLNGIGYDDPPFEAADAPTDSSPCPISKLSSSQETPVRSKERDEDNTVISVPLLRKSLTPLSIVSTPFARIDLLSKWIPLVDPDAEESQSFQKKWNDLKSVMAWQLGITAAVLIVNFVFTIYLWVKYDTTNGIGTLYEGSCSTANNLNLWIHFLLNVLSSGLLGCSSYCMQLLLTPTREEVDQAHRRGQWLDIGAPSQRNFKTMRGTRRVIWIVLGITSTTLHLFWNTAIFSAIPVQSYAVAVVTEDYMQNTERWQNLTSQLAPTLLRMQQDMLSWERLDHQDCIERYMEPLKPGRNLVIVTKNTHSSNASDHEYAAFMNTSLIKFLQSPDPWWKWKEGSFWVCSDNWVAHNISSTNFCDIGQMEPYMDDWWTAWSGTTMHWGDGTVLLPGASSAPVDYCLSEGVAAEDEGCGVQFSTTIMVIVCIVNLVKLLCITCLILMQKRETLVTIGDAIASFLQKADMSTKGMCLLDVDSVRNGSLRPIPRPWVAGQTRLFAAASRRRWVLTYAPCITIVLIAITLNIAASAAVSASGISLGSIWHRSFGQTVGAEVLGGIFTQLYRRPSIGFVICVLFANSFQSLISIVYLMLNALLTSISVAVEFSHFDKPERQSLRVTNPRGIQRSTYFLSLPYRFSIPLITVTSLLHWLVSQAVSPIRTTFINPDGTPNHAYDNTVVSTSIVGLTASLIVGIVLLAACAGVGFARYKSDLPLVGTCSLAISAACHRPEEDEDAHLMPVKWGVVSVGEKWDHCAISTMQDGTRPDRGRGPGKVVEKWKYS